MALVLGRPEGEETRDRKICVINRVKEKITKLEETGDQDGWLPERWEKQGVEVR